ncbi:MAG: TerB family tellurite resistance protein [Deltaproteobacteria bacterium]|nr:TerB family tellurite resistance protein [Deltaproteobacteria bacterium]MDQ3298605.1 TerB family tellurite resistance protein [Myxococcota bacterium]
MAESQILSVIRVWAAMAWADGVLAEAEAESLRRLVGSADLTADERAVATTFVTTRCTLPDTYLTALTPEARRGIYRAACRMAVVDRAFAAAERGMLDKLRDLLGVPADVATEIEADVPGLG